ncbi:MAG: hypothetical protein RLY93_15185 [Sumerlaeia bacterium]
MTQPAHRRWTLLMPAAMLLASAFVGWAVYFQGDYSLFLRGGPVGDGPRVLPFATPGPDLSPVEVVAIQLRSLQRVDYPGEDDGIRVARRFASPSNRAALGPERNFIRMLKSPDYAHLLGASEYNIVSQSGSEDERTLVVTVLDQDGIGVTYLWAVSRQAGGECDGCWMTEMVMKTAELPQAIGPRIEA